MKRVRTKYGLVLVVAVGIALLFVWAGSRRQATYGKDWLLVSTPLVGSRTNAGASTPVVAFRVSNVGPRSLDFQVWWFECRAKRDRTVLATNQLNWVKIPLGPGESTNLAMDVSLAGVPAEDCLCCFQLYWFERESPWHSGARDLGRRWFELFGVYWEPSLRQKHLTNGVVFVANVKVADYFRWMYGFTRTQWLEELARQRSAVTQAISGLGRQRYREPTTDERLKFEARDAFGEFCRESTNGNPDAKPVAAP